MRRAPGSPEEARAARVLRSLVVANEAVLIGPVRQEALSSIESATRFREVRNRMRGFVDSELITFDYERAAEFVNVCRAAGVAGSPVDFLICAAAERLAQPIYTLDTDFERYRDLLGIELYQPA